MCVGVNPGPLHIVSPGGTGSKNGRALYVGARVCAECHDGPRAGHQYSRFLLTKHAQAYAVLARPESKKIAELSGIPQEPQQSPMCLGCHSTGTFAEAVEKDETFFFEDGMQCETCHGPGSDHVDAKRRPTESRQGHIRLIHPVKRDCLNCHKEKGSHTAVLKRPPIDMDKAWDEIAHPRPEGGISKPNLVPALPAHGQKRPAPLHRRRWLVDNAIASRLWVTSISQWRMSKHAEAYAVLATPAAFEIGQGRGPQR